MTRVTDKMWNSTLPNLKIAAREGIISSSVFNDNSLRPTHVLDIYKMRRGRYKNVRIWLRLNLGTGERIDLFLTTADNVPITYNLDTFSTSIQREIEDWNKNERFYV